MATTGISGRRGSSPEPGVSGASRAASWSALARSETLLVALSGDGNTALIAGQQDNSSTGAAWVFVQPLPPTLQVTPTTPNAGHGFVHWTDNGKVVSASESYTFALDSNVTL